MQPMQIAHSPEQQLNIERIRAVEMGRSVVVAATTGISAAIDANGVVVESLGDGEVGSFVYATPILKDRTPASFIAPWLELIICVFTLITLAWLMLAKPSDRQI